jgi:hypothetical protein
MVCFTLSRPWSRVLQLLLLYACINVVARCEHQVWFLQFLKFPSVATHYNTVVDMGHFKVPLMSNKVILIIYLCTLKYDSFTHVHESF